MKKCKTCLHWSRDGETHHGACGKEEDLLRDELPFVDRTAVSRLLPGGDFCCSAYSENPK